MDDSSGARKVLTLVPVGDGHLKRVVLDGAEQALIGRSSRCQVRLPTDSRLVSRIHASITLRDETWYLTDESRRGTYLQGQRLAPSEPRVIHHGDSIRCGEFEFVAYTENEDESLGPEGTYTMSSQSVDLRAIDTSKVLQSALELPVLLGTATEPGLYSVACEYLVNALSPAIATAYVTRTSPAEGVTVLGRAERSDVSSTRRELLRPIVSKRIVERLLQAPESVLFMHRSLADAGFSATVNGAPQTIGASLLETYATDTNTILYAVGDMALGREDQLIAQYLRLVATLVRQHILVLRRSHLARYFSPNVIQLLAQPGGQALLEGEPHAAPATSFFFDVRGSSLPLDATQQALGLLYQDLRRVLSIVTDAVFEAGGTVIDYAGDSVFAVWGVPFAQSNHADLAVGCALEVVRRLDLARFRVLPVPSASRLCGIGLATGEVLAGPVGSSVVFKYGVFGPSVSAAQRLVTLTKPGPGLLDRPILMTADVAALLSEHRSRVRHVGRFELQGMASLVDVYEGRVDA